MSGKSLINVDPLRLKSLRDRLLEMVKEVDSLIEVRGGCLHENREEISTMGGQSVRRFFCHDCGKTVEEEWSEDDMESYS